MANKKKTEPIVDPLKYFIIESKDQKKQIAHNIKILNLISVADCFVMKKFFNSCFELNEFNKPNYQDQEKVKKIIDRANRMRNIKKFYINYKTANLIYPFDIFGTADFKTFFFSQEQSTRDKFYQEIKKINSFGYNDFSFKKDINNIISYRSNIYHNKKNNDKNCENFFTAIKKFIPSTKFINELEQLVFNKKNNKKNLIKIPNFKKFFPDDHLNKNKFLTNPKLHTMHERLSFVGFDNISKIKDWLRSLENFSEDRYFVNSKNVECKIDTNKFVKHIKFEEIEAIFFWVIELNYILKKYFVRIFEIFEKIIDSKDIDKFSEIKDLRNKIAHSHLIIGEIISATQPEELKFETRYYQDIFTKILNYFDQIFLNIENDKSNELNKILIELQELNKKETKNLYKKPIRELLLEKILIEKIGFLQALKGLTNKFDNYRKLNKEKTNLAQLNKEKTNSLKEKSKLFNNKKIFYNDVIKFHFYGLLKSEFYKIICDVKKINYQSNSCIKLKKNYNKI
ncbi:hypothetical protein LBMAG18_11810 [Alphaproteobacteria bacterium]|nr:hypothetical protein LBMAG18_11810 [Alphaproteobacteria bacterium]